MGPQVGVVGLGLMGSSIARAAAHLGSVLGWDPALDPDRSLPGITIVPTMRDVCRADLIVLAAPTTANEDHLRALAGAHRSGTATALARAVPTMDIGSAKESIVATWERDAPDHPFVATHPMAGSERSGWRAGSDRLVEGAAWAVVVTPRTDPDALITVMRFILDLRAHPVPVTARGHDQSVATISHLPHLLAGVLGRVIEAGSHRDLTICLAAGSYADASRVSASPPERTAELLLANAPSAAAAARRAGRDLAQVAQLLEGGNADALAAWLDVARRVRGDVDGQAPGATRKLACDDPSAVRDAVLALVDTGGRVIGMEREESPRPASGRPSGQGDRTSRGIVLEVADG